MKQELDELLCKKYPKMMVNRNKDMKETCMCWGFDCGDGWYNILDQLMGNIQHHIDWKRKHRASALQYNRCLKRAISGDKAGLIWYNTYGDATPGPWVMERVDEAIAEEAYRKVPESVHQVTLDQVKEKFGTLRFYYTGGDSVIDGMVRMAESMSGVMCEECGTPGERRGGGWVRTLCDHHEHMYNTNKRKYTDENQVS